MKRRRASAAAAEAPDTLPPRCEVAGAGPTELRRKKRRKLQRPPQDQTALESEREGVERSEEGRRVELLSAALGEDKEDRRGIIHMTTVPYLMSVAKVRHIMERFGEVGRIYLVPEDQVEEKRRKRLTGNHRKRFCEGWIEFADRKIAKNVAATLNGTSLGGRKRHNFFRDDIWTLCYLPKFKWHQIKEGEIYNQQVRKARLVQKMTQAQKENSHFLEKVEQAKVKRRIAQRKEERGEGAAVAGELPRRPARSSWRRGRKGRSYRIISVITCTISKASHSN